MQWNNSASLLLELAGNLRFFLFWLTSAQSVCCFEGGIRNKAAYAAPFKAGSLIHELALIVGEIYKSGFSRGEPGPTPTR
jgi:hypothetical protein